MKRLSSKFSKFVINRSSTNINQKTELYVYNDVEGTMRIINEQIYQI